MATITDESHFGHMSGYHPRFVVRGNHPEGGGVCQAFATRAEAERFRNRIWPKPTPKPATARASRSFSGDLRNIVDEGTTMHFMKGAAYLGAVRQGRGGYEIDRPGLPAPVVVRSWDAVLDFATCANFVTDKDPR